jgi:hypothetical protein
MLGFEFRFQLRLEAVGCLLKLRFGPRYMSEDCRQPLWTQQQQSEHKHEHDFRSKSHDLLLNKALIVSGDRYCGGWLCLLGFHRCLEAADTLSDSFAEFGQLFGAEDEQGNSEDNQQVHGLEQSFKHRFSLNHNGKIIES